jgi:formylglycine-generating enzyme required for sulfatase activity
MINCERVTYLDLFTRCGEIMRRLIGMMIVLVLTSVVASAQATKTAATARNEKDGAEMVWVPAGEFTMGGDDPWAGSDEKPMHKVRISKGFWLYRTEVTNAQYRKFVNATGHAPPDGAGNINGDYKGSVKFWQHPRYNAPDQPVVGVNWDDAQAYCKWAGVRLPTEAEWEYAARGTDGRKYPWGNGKPDATRAVFDRPDKTASPSKVGSLPAGASWCGAFDLAGNVWEWCADVYSDTYYRSSPPVDPVGPSGDGARVIRGGMWYSSWLELRASCRLFYPRDISCDNLGFRPARAATKP